MGTALLAGGAGLAGGALLAEAFDGGDDEREAYEDGESECHLVRFMTSYEMIMIGREDQFQQDQYDDGGGDFGGGDW